MRRFGAGAAVFVVAFLAMVGYCRWWQWLEDTREAEAQAAEAQIDAVRSVDGMAGWLVSGAGITDYNGEYSAAGSHGGKSYYSHVGTLKTYYLFWDNAGYGYQWLLGEDVEDAGGSSAYGGAGETLPANPWSVLLGEAPAPNLSEIIDDAGESLESPVGVLVDEAPEDGWWDLTVTVPNVSNTSETEAQDIICAWYTETEPYTLIAYETETVTAGSKVTATFDFGRHPEVNGYLLIWGGPFIRVPLVSGAYYEAWNVGWVFPDPPRVITLGSRLSGPEMTTGAEAEPGAGDRLSGYSVLLDVGDVEFASGFGVMQHVEAEFASAYTTAIRPGVYAPSSIGVFGEVSAEAESSYSVRGERVEKTILASYSVNGKLVPVEFASAYTTEGTIGGGPGMLLMALMQDN